jgi:hypothetical protein
MRFAVDSMLGRLARWMRLSGYDVTYLRGWRDKDILMLAAKENRILLSRDSALCQRASKKKIKCLYVKNGDVLGQLRQVVEELQVELSETPGCSRCPKCNGEIIKAEEESISRVPENVKDSVEEFWECTACGQVYWEGSHWRNIREVVRKVRDVQDSREG